MNMNIITSIPRGHNNEVSDSFLRELINGRRLERERKAFLRDRKAHEQSKWHKGTTNPVLGKCVMSMDQADWFDMRNKYGHEAMHDTGFIRDFNKKHPELSPNKA